MIFGEFPPEIGLILAHDIRAEGCLLKKGEELTLQDVEFLQKINYASVMAAKLEPGDQKENLAAVTLAQKLAGNNLLVDRPLHGRVNLRARKKGLLNFEPKLVKDFNLAMQDALLATLPPFSLVYPQDIVATIKVVPFALSAETLNKPVTGQLEVAEFVRKKVILLQTVLPGIKAEILAKSALVQKQRLADLGSDLGGEIRCVHETKSIIAAIDEVLALDPGLILFLGAAAASDRRDILPQAISNRGGRIEYFGLPVDPGNLLFGGELANIPFIGVPGCGRSPKLNGFDLILRRVLGGLPLGEEEIASTGIGGLLQEVWDRPVPREDKMVKQGNKFAAIILAAGQSTRMGRNKLLLDFQGKPMLLHAVDVALALKLDQVIVVVGSEAELVRQALGKRELDIIDCPDYRLGMGYSLRAGITGLSQDIVGFFIMLGDMPEVTSEHLAEMLDNFREHSIVVPCFNYKRGNPVLWSRDFISDMQRISGDQGARSLITANQDRVISVNFADSGVVKDYDTPESLIKG